MGEILKLILCIYLITLIFSIVVSLIKFIVDTYRWHDKEEKIELVTSALEAEATEEDTKNQNESEVEKNGTNDGECNTSVISFPWSQS